MLDIKNHYNKNEDGLSLLGLYIHIPFCEKKCDYCDFLSSVSDQDTKMHYVDGLLKEIKGYKDLAKDYIVHTIFIGGGTPSAIPGSDIYNIMEQIRDVFVIGDDSEITIEINPGIVSKDKLIWYQKAGINRISFGLQSAHNDELKLLGRIHSYEQFTKNYQLARDLGFKNINIDLMSALPGQTKEDFLDTLQTVIPLSPEHISCYSLIIEEETPFYERYGHEERDEELDRQIYDMTGVFLEEQGYCQYEISNYAKKGYECRQNTTYWRRGEYLGIGLGSSSLLGNTRFYNEKDMDIYIKESSNPYMIRREVSLLTLKEQMEEFMFLGLRLTNGIDIGEFFEIFHVSIDEMYGDAIGKSIDEGLLESKENRLYLTKKGMDLSNVVMARFIFD